MKTTLSLSFAAALVFLVTGAAQSQYSPVGADGIAASPRLRERIEASTTKRVVAAPVMACSTCVDVVSVVPDTAPKGLGAKTLLAQGPATTSVAKHLCGSCSTSYQLKGTGKGKVNVATHACAATSTTATAGGCCATTTTTVIR